MRGKSWKRLCPYSLQSDRDAPPPNCADLSKATWQNCRKLLGQAVSFRGAREREAERDRGPPCGRAFSLSSVRDRRQTASPEPSVVKGDASSLHRDWRSSGCCRTRCAIDGP